MQSRYHRQTLLPNIGHDGQQALAAAKVLVVGAGGLGCPCLQYLVGAGVGSITIADGDWIELSNLARQTLFNESDIGKPKAEVAKARLEQQNPHIRIVAIHEAVDEHNVYEWVGEHHLVIDCSDQFTVRYRLNDCCVELNKPYIYAANYQYEGQVAVFENKKKNLNLRSLFPVPPKNPTDCLTAGALGPVLGMLGSLQALEAIKVIIQHPERLNNELLQLDLITYHMHRFAISESIPSEMPASSLSPYQELDIPSFLEKIHSETALIVDVRQPGERPVADFQHILIPVNELPLRIDELPRDKEIVLFCHSGIRSLHALEVLHDEFQFERISHLKGGIIKYMAYLNSTS